MSTITPFVKRMRTQGGTIYTFSSALEDIGLNINERNNVVKMSHYALLDIPAVTAPTNIQQNTFNVLAIPGAYESFQNSGSIKDGRVLIAESFQNYALNLETNLLAQTTYNPALLDTVSERVFWKWLKETGAIRWQKFDTSIGTYWVEEADTDSSIGYNSVVKCIGQISAGSVRTDTFGTYNETYVLVPTSFGQTPVYFKEVEDDNYYHGLSITNGNANILGRENYLSPHPDALEYLAYYDLADSSTYDGSYPMQYDNSTGSYSDGWWWTQEDLPISNDNCYFIDTSSYKTTGITNIKLTYSGSGVEFYRSKVDCMSVEYDINNLRSIIGDSALSFNSLAIEYATDDKFDFNAILIYYSVYNKSLDTILATNLLGVLFLDAPSGNSSTYPDSNIILPLITKLQSTANGFGTSYSFRLNIKSDYMLDDTAATIVDETTGADADLILTNFSEVFDNLSKTLSILNQHTGTINYITEQYLDISDSQTNILNQINDLTYKVNDVTKDITGTTGTIPIFSDGDDPLTDSSIYMKNGFVGILTTSPMFPLDINGSLHSSSIYINDSILDISGNILLSYDSSQLTIGDSGNSKDVLIYAGNNPVMYMDSSSITINTNLIINASIYDASNNAYGSNIFASYDYVNSSLNARDLSINELYDIVENIDYIELPLNSGEMVLIDKPVDASAALNTEESYDFNIDGSLSLKIYAKSNGAGGINSDYGAASINYFYFGDPGSDPTIYKCWRMYVKNSSDSLIMQKRLTNGTWQETHAF